MSIENTVLSYPPAKSRDISKYVMDNSKRYVKLAELVDSVNMKKIIIPRSLTERYTLNSKREFDELTFEGPALNWYIYNDRVRLEKLLLILQHNVRLKRAFYDEYDMIYKYPTLKGFEVYEDDLVNGLFNSVAINTDFIITLILSYTSPKGQNHYEFKHKFSTSVILKEIKRCRESMDRRKEFERFRDAERAKMTPSVRFNVLKRDNFMCQVCGVTAEHGVTLHVDHVIPIAKWGRSDEGNLQTLCQDCNLGKGTLKG